MKISRDSIGVMLYLINKLKLHINSKLRVLLMQCFFIIP